MARRGRPKKVHPQDNVLPFPPETSKIVWFGRMESVVQTEDGRRSVFVGGTLIGSFGRGDRPVRNALLLGLASDPNVNKAKMCAAFGVSTDTLASLIRIAAERGTLAALGRAPKGRKSKVTPEIRRRLERAFDQGLTVDRAHEKVKGSVGRTAVVGVRKAWAAARQSGAAPAADDGSMQASSPADESDADADPDGLFSLLALARRTKEADARGTSEEAPAVVVDLPPTAPSAPAQPIVVQTDVTEFPAPEAPHAAAAEEPSFALVGAASGVVEQVENTEPPTPVALAVAALEEGVPFASDAEGPVVAIDIAHLPTPVARRMAAPEERVSVSIGDAELRSARMVQHLGTWLMMAMVARLGLHAQVEKLCTDRHDGKSSLPHELRSLRIALDATIAALSIHQRCVEGVRRLATSTGALLLRAKRPPSASWVRTILGGLAHSLGGAMLHLRMAAGYIREAYEDNPDGPQLYYIDNHMRAYTGQEKMLSGWKMKEKRALPGTMDYWVHDAEGCPILRVDAKATAPLTAWLSPLARILRDVLGTDVPIVLGFDRGGAFPVQLATLRDAGIGFVTYEKGPYRRFPKRAFSKSFRHDGKTIEYFVTRTNLGKERGRVGRIAHRMPDGKQINLLTIGEVSPQKSYEFARLRWNQENGLKHGNERWGGNQLDGRQFNKADPNMIIRNPARRRLERAIAFAKAREGRARADLARRGRGASEAKREHAKVDLREAIAHQKELLAQRPNVPTRAAVSETELAHTLVVHRGDYKAVIDTIRVACANAEAELAGMLGPLLRRPTEAKKVIANILNAPGSVHVGAKSISVALDPAGSKSELKATEEFLTQCSQLNLTLPGDPDGRLLRFSLRVS